VRVDELLEKLEGVQPRGSGWIAQCPAHEDSSPSLSVDETEDGNVLLKCHAGCSFEAIAKAVGMSGGGRRDRWDPEKAEAKYDYTDERGALLFQVLRMPGKEFPTRHHDGERWHWGIEGIQRVPYKLPQLLEAVAAGKWIVIVEGEKDADAGNTFAGAEFFFTCNPGGAGKWRPEYARYLAQAKVIIWADKDEPGRNHADTVRKALTGVAASIAIVQSAFGKDAHDHLVGANLTMKQVVRAENQFLLLRGIVTAKDLATRALEDLDMTEESLPGYVLVPGVNVTWRKGRFYAIGGYTGDGKTTWELHGVRSLAMAGTRGGVFSLEMPERDLRNRMIAHWGIPLYLLEEPWRLKGNPEMWARYHQAVEEIKQWNVDIIFDTQVTAQSITEITREREYDWIAIDHIHRFGWGSERRQLEAEITKLTNLAIEQNVMVVALCQLREPRQKGKDFDTYPQPTLQDFRETGVVGQEASMAISVWRRRDQTGLRYLPGGQTSVQILKNRHTTGRRTAVGNEFFLHFDETTCLYSATHIPAPEDTPSAEEAIQNDPWFQQQPDA
jgi:replicative DNA helicase